MRNVSNGLPLQIVMKSQPLLIKTMLELAKVKKLLAAEVVASKEIDWNTIVGTAKHAENKEDQSNESFEEINEESDHSI